MSDVTGRLRQVAGQATPGPWQVDGPWWHDEDDPVAVVTRHDGRSAVAMMPPLAHLSGSDDRRPWTAAHVATFDPVLVAAMLDVIDAMQEMISPVYDGHEGPYLGGVRADEMQAVIDALARFREVAS